MPFQKENKIAKGRPKGSKNKAKKVKKSENGGNGVTPIDLPLFLD